MSAEKIANADYGAKPPANYKSIIKEEFSKILIDPTSPIYEIREPKRGYFQTAPVYGTREEFGWRVCGTINSKNRLGGYTGKAPFVVLMRGSVVTQKLLGSSDNSSVGDSVFNKTISEACN